MKYGVNIDLANDAKKEMATHIDHKNSRILNSVGAFACLYDIDLNGYDHPVLVLKTEEPGSKQLIAMQHDRIEGVCYDMINHLINDCIVMGATPLAVQDAIICGKMDKSIVTRIVRAISDACMENGCLLTGGETSEQPNVIGENTYILTSSIVGVVEKSKVVDGHSIEVGDLVIGLSSNGIHTNGYTLVRTIMEHYPEILNEDIDGMSFIDAILLPHLCYYNALKDLFGKGLLKGMAHITGGGVKENLNRILPEHVNALINLNEYEIPTVFKVIRRYGKINDAEMLRTFNMGVGLTAVVSRENVDTVLQHLNSNTIPSKIIGEIVQGNKQVKCTGSFNWD